MSVHKQMEALTDQIEASYGTRLAAVSDSAKETHRTLGNFHQQHHKMANDLKRSLASNRSSRVRQVYKMRARNETELKTMTSDLNGFLSAAEKTRSEEFAFLMEHIKGVVAAIEKDTVETLAGFKHDHQEMTSSLRNELSAFQTNLRKTVDDMLTEFSADHQQTHTAWKNLTTEKEAIKAGKRVPPTKEAIAEGVAIKKAKKPSPSTKMAFFTPPAGDAKSL